MDPVHVRHPNANTVFLDPRRFRRYFWLRRIPLSAIGPLFGRCEGWASVICHKGHAGYHALDELSVALGVHVDDLIREVGAEIEFERLAVS